jgi:hypothetical protein
MTSSCVIKLSSDIVRGINWEGPATLVGDKSSAHGALSGKPGEKW